MRGRCEEDARKMLQMGFLVESFYLYELVELVELPIGESVQLEAFPA